LAERQKRREYGRSRCQAGIEKVVFYPGCLAGKERPRKKLFFPNQRGKSSQESKRKKKSKVT